MSIVSIAVEDRPGFTPGPDPYYYIEAGRLVWVQFHVFEADPRAKYSFRLGTIAPVYTTNLSGRTEYTVRLPIASQISEQTVNAEVMEDSQLIFSQPITLRPPDVGPPAVATGMVNITSNVAGATGLLNGPGLAWFPFTTPYELPGMTAGEYYVQKWDELPGYITPMGGIPKTLGTGGSITLHGEYVPVRVTPSPVSGAAILTIIGLLASGRQ